MRIEGGGSSRSNGERHIRSLRAKTGTSKRQKPGQACSLGGSPCLSSRVHSCLGWSPFRDKAAAPLSPSLLVPRAGLPSSSSQGHFRETYKLICFFKKSTQINYTVRAPQNQSIIHSFIHSFIWPAHCLVHTAEQAFKRKTIYFLNL